jgi:hypothetical protein
MDDGMSYEWQFVGVTSNFAFFLRRTTMNKESIEAVLGQLRNESEKAKIEYIDGKILLHCYKTMEAEEASQTIQIFPIQ